jgi:hypothetical protein
MPHLALALALAGCGAQPQAIVVALRVPSGDKPLALADGLSLALRGPGGEVLALERTPVDAPSIGLDAVAPAAGYTVELDATLGPDVVARGRSCAFDVIAGQPAPRVAVYFSRVGAFAATAGSAEPRLGAACFPSGSGALIAGGNAGGPALASSEQYDVAGGRFAPGPTMATPRQGALAAVLPDGAALVLGGAVPGAPGIDVLAQGAFAPAPSAFPPELADAAAVVLGDGRALVAGGSTASESPTAAARVISADGSLVVSAGPLVQARRRFTLTLGQGRAPVS